jgi:hypothetical protein
MISQSIAGDLALLASFVFLAGLGLALIRSVTNAEAEPRSASPDVDAQVDALFLKSWRRARRGRRIARLIFAVAVSVAAVAALLITNAQNTMGGHSDDLVDLIMPVVGVIGIAVGLAWMWRILRADPEPDRNGWLYRSR